MKTFLPAVSLLLFLGLASATRLHAMDDKTQRLVDKLPAGTVKLLDQPYIEGTKAGKNPDSIQTLDLFVPEGKGPFPLVIWIHGGGWHGGGKETEAAAMALTYLPKGLAVAGVNYRYTTDGAPFPAQIEDCNAALAWLRRHAAEYHLDPDRVGVVGHSAGAHLSALMATTGDTPLFSKGLDESVRVQAAVCWAGPFDLDRDRGGWPAKMFVWNAKDQFCQTFFVGGAYSTEQAQKASPASYVKAGLPPMLIVHGAKDESVSIGQATAFVDNVKKAGNDVTYRIEPEKGHSVMSADASKEALAFFERVLLGKDKK